MQWRAAKTNKKNINVNMFITMASFSNMVLILGGGEG